MNTKGFFTRLCHSPSLRRATFTLVTLLALEWSSPAFCGEIHDAARDGDLEKVTALLKDNPDLVFRKEDNYGLTPLHTAAIQGHKDVAELLLANKAEVDARDNKGETPLHTAALMGHRDVVEVLLASKAEVDARDNNGYTALHWAAVKGHRDVAELLLASKADVNAQDMQGKRTPLHLAASEGNKDIAELLLANKAEVNAGTTEGVTPLDAAAMQGHKDVAALLLANKAAVNAKDSHGYTPLYWAAGKGRKGVVELLLASETEVNPKANDGTTPLDMAMANGYNDVAELLRQHGAGGAAPASAAAMATAQPDAQLAPRKTSPVVWVLAVFLAIIMLIGAGWFVVRKPAESAMATAQPGAQFAPRRTSPVVWVPAVFLGIVILIGAGWFVVRKSHEAGIDSELWQRNPGLAERKLLAITNPSLEVVRTDDSAGTITLRERRTGEESTITFDQARNGKTGLGRPAWLPEYPGSHRISQTDEAGYVGFTTGDPVSKVMTFYQYKAKEIGMEVQVRSTAAGGMLKITGVVGAGWSANTEDALIEVRKDGGGAWIAVAWATRR
jgi:ankyrin repeat protein